MRLDNVAHARLRIATGHGAEYGDAVNQIALFLPEFEDAQRHYPILFRRQENGSLQAVAILGCGDIGLLENTRFWPGEEANDPEFAKAIAANGDLYVDDAFSAAHRAHASTEGITHFLPSYAGRAMQREIEALESALGDPKRPVVAVIGGAKVSSKIDVLVNLVAKVDALVIGGGMANTFLLARGVAIGKSLAEPDLVDTAKQIMAAADKSSHAVVLPVDAVVAREFKAGG